MISSFFTLWSPSSFQSFSVYQISRRRKDSCKQNLPFSFFISFLLSIDTGEIREREMEREEGATTTTIGVVPAAPAKSATPIYSLSFWEVTTASGVVLGFLVGLVCVYLTMPQSDYSFLKLPRNLEDLQILRWILLSLGLIISGFLVKMQALVQIQI